MPKYIMIIVMLAIFMTGCGRSENSKFYLLSANHGDVKRSVLKKVNIGLGPVKLANYLDRPQIVTSTNGSEVNLSEFHRWAEPLSDNITRVLTENLKNLLPIRYVYQYPWRQSANFSYQLQINIIRFEATAAGACILVATWQILNRTGKILLSKKTKLTIAVSANSGYSGIVDAMNLALFRFSKVLSDNLRHFLVRNG